MVLTPGVCASSPAEMRRPTGARIDHPQGDGGNSASLPGESTKDTVKTIRAGKAGMSRRHLSFTPCAFFRTRGTSGASRRPAFPAPLLSMRVEEGSKARAKQAARTRSCVRYVVGWAEPLRTHDV